MCEKGAQSLREHSSPSTAPSPKSPAQNCPHDGQDEVTRLGSWDMSPRGSTYSGLRLSPGWSLSLAASTALGHPHHFTDEEWRSIPPVTQPPHVPSPVQSFLPTPLRGLSCWDHMWPQHLSREEPPGATESVMRRCRKSSRVGRSCSTTFLWCSFECECLTLGTLLSLCQPWFPHL